MIAEFNLAREMDAREVHVKIDSQLVVSQVKGEAQVKDALLHKYLAMVKERIGNFDSVEIIHIPREQYKTSDVLSKLSSTRTNKINHSFIQDTLEKPSYGTSAIKVAMAEPAPRTWMTPIKAYIDEGKLADDPLEAKTIKRRACKHTIIEEWLFKRGFSSPLLKYLNPDEALYALEEVHEGIVDQHLGGQTLTRKLLIASLYWPTMMSDSMEYVKKCDKFQRLGGVFNAPSSELGALTTALPFVR